MRGNGLKFQIIITLLLLLVMAMLLANLVMTMFWQQSLLRQEAHRVQDILKLQAAQLEHSGGLPDAQRFHFLDNMITIAGFSCAAVAYPDKIILPEDDCGQKSELGDLLETSLQNRLPVTRTIGSAWGVFAPRPELLLTAIPFTDSEGSSASIGAASPLKPIHRYIRQQQKNIFAYLLVNTLLLATIGFFRLARTTVKPLEQLVRLTEAYDAQQDFLLFPERTGNEFGRLSAALNQMTHRIEEDRRRLKQMVASLEAASAAQQQTQQEMIRAEKLAAIGRLSAGLAHEIGNPMGIIQGYLELLQNENLSPEDRNQYSRRAISELDRINRLIRQLLDFARSSPAGSRMLHIHELLKKIVEMFKYRKKMENITFELALDAENDLVLANEESMQQVLLNCLLNAVDAINELNAHASGKIIVSTVNVAAKTDQPDIVISIRDNGSGIAAADLDKIFDPFFTTKEPGRGTGLGLSVSYSIVESAGGRMEAESIIDQGTEIKIILPTTS